jgi:glutamyl-Q tRNA(Asp) synthetase
MSHSDKQSDYVGRFAPSPTGFLHKGSLIAAIASYCDAMKNNGKWLVRIEDIDPPREISGASKGILSTLKNYGFQFHADVLYQSTRYQAYSQILDQLKEKPYVYVCACSRADLKMTTIESHICRNSKQTLSLPYNYKCKVPNTEILFNDLIQGEYITNLYQDHGDFVLKRKDKLFSYQLAVVIDDNYQGITHIVRGIDLIDSTPWQIHLNSLLGFKQPIYAHIPILTDNKGQKLSKQSHAKEIDNQKPLETLINTYQYLNQTPFSQKPQSIDQFWQHAISHWKLNKIAKVHEIKV